MTNRSFSSMSRNALLTLAALCAASTACTGECPAPPPPPLDEGVDDGPPTSCTAVGGIGFRQPKPNVMLLADRSGSMGESGSCAAGNCVSKWEQMLALGDYLATVKQRARLGLSVFPALDDSCGASSENLVPITGAGDVDEQILTAVSSIEPDGSTPTAAALDEIAALGALEATDRDNIVVLLTDGRPTGERTRVVDAVARFTDGPVPRKLYVVGIGDGAASAGETLHAMAEAAGTALPEPPFYYQADTIESLIGRLFQVAADLAPCRFNLDDVPAAEDLIVHIDDVLAAPCTDSPCTSGYTYDLENAVVELHGSTCQLIRDGACHDVWFDTTAD